VRPSAAGGSGRTSREAALKILFVGDVFGSPGRRAVEARLPALRDELRADFCVVNGENAADGRGITAKLADRLLASGADVVTLGNWAWGQRGFAPYLSGTDRVLRPANLSPSSPGTGLAVHDGVAVINLLGQMTLNPFESPFTAIERLVAEAARATPVIVVDFHAEATSEKIAMAHHLAGRVTAVLGTHTHVQTNDARVLAGGTAAITDAGMTGPHDSVIGSKPEGPIRRFVTGFPVRLEVAENDVRIEGVLVECGADGRATACEAIRVPVE
jgi:metallophosphoesterase (TIGR00282 family)